MPIGEGANGRGLASVEIVSFSVSASFAINGHHSVVLLLYWPRPLCFCTGAPGGPTDCRGSCVCGRCGGHRARDDVSLPRQLRGGLLQHLRRAGGRPAAGGGGGGGRSRFGHPARPPAAASTAAGAAGAAAGGGGGVPAGAAAAGDGQHQHGGAARAAGGRAGDTARRPVRSVPGSP